MSTSRHPVALRLEQFVGEGTKLLATVMGLPLVDGIFPALVLAGAIDGPMGILEVGLLVFGGSATLAVVLADMEGTRRQQISSVLVVGVILMLVAAVEAALAPTIESVLNMVVFKRFAALVILAIAAKTASATIGEYLPSPGIIVGLGLVASFEPSGFSMQFVAQPMLIVHAVAAAGVGVGFALSAAVFGPWLRGNVDIDRFRFGSAVALGVLPLSILGIIQANVPLALSVLAITSILALNPGGGNVSGSGSTSTPVPDGGASSEQNGPQNGDSVVDGDHADETDNDPDDSDDSGVSDGDRAPWL